jgi:penicillin-binding protein 2
VAGRLSRGGDSKSARLAYILLAGLLLLLGSRLFTVQVVQHRKFQRLALENQFRIKRVIAPRGVIRDRTGKPLVDNVADYELYVDAAALRSNTGLMAALARDFAVDTLAARTRWEAQRARGRGRGSLPVKVLDHVSKEQVSLFEQDRVRYAGADLVPSGRRRYIYRDFATHVLGYVGEVSQAAVDSTDGRPRGYRLGDVWGRSGVEVLCEDDLRGYDGARFVQVNAAGQELFELVDKAEPPVPGHDLELTIDWDLQHAIETELWPPGKAGAAVVIDVHTGELLAAVSEPGYDLNRFSTGISTGDYEVLRADPLTPLFNRYARAGYPPGSTFKIVSSTAALDNNIVRIDQSLQPCHGSYQVGNHVFRCWDKKGHGSLAMLHGFEQSCDVYFYQLARPIGTDRLAATARRLGLGHPTGFDLPEERGLIPDTDYYNRVYGERGWTTTFVVNCIIGQGEVLVTPLQMARLAAAVANGGQLFKPQIVHRVLDAKGAVLRTCEPKLEREGIFTPEEAKFLRKAMLQVVIGERGTGHAALPESLLVAGKTGTAQSPGGGGDHAWFVFFAPWDDPQIAGAVIVEQAGHGGSISAPLVRQLVSRYYHIPDNGPAYWRRMAELRAAGWLERGAP